MVLSLVACTGTYNASNFIEYTILSLRLQTLVSFIWFQGLTPSFSHSSLYAHCMTRLPCTTLIRQINSLYEIGAEFTCTMSHFALFAHFSEALILWQVSQMSYNLSKDVCFLGQTEIRTQMHQPKCHLESFLSAWKKLFGSKQHCKFVCKNKTHKILIISITAPTPLLR